MLKISLDLDDTIFNWEGHYLEKFGKPKNDFEINRNVMTTLLIDKEFWMSQPLINVPNFTPWIYCTARVIPKQWIKEQIKLNLLPIAPIYQVFGAFLSKAPQLKRAKPDVHVDDSLSVFKNLNSVGIPCLLLDSPNNQEWGPVGRVYSLDKEEIEDTYHLFKQTLFPYFKELL